MTPISTIQKNKNNMSFLGGLLGISIIILIHELGHYCAAHLFSIPTPLFSIGFGPTLVKIPFGDTIFQIALLPFGGYVEINQEILIQHPYTHKMIVMLGGIIFNLIFSFLIISYYSLRKTKTQQHTPLQACLTYISEQNEAKGFVGPIGLIRIIGKSFTINNECFWIILAIVSTNIAFFNLLPLPFLDGGKALLFTIETLFGQSTISSNITFLSLFLFLCFIMIIIITSINDIKTLRNKN